MKEVDEKLSEITEMWNHYFLEYKFFQRHINFNSDVKSNYYGDISRFFSDTFELVEIKEDEQNFQKNVFNSIGILQIIYVQQDLIDELLHIFKIKKSSLSDKEPNRKIRNELIGHPIRKAKNGELISSVFFANGLSNSAIRYILYEREDNFKGVHYYYSIKDILDRHRVFLLKYLDIILQKTHLILKKFDKKIDELNDLIVRDVEFEKLLNYIGHNCEYNFETAHLFKKDLLFECYNRKLEHPRYKFAVDLFIECMKSYIVEVKRDIKEIVTQSKYEETSRDTKTEIKFIDYSEQGEAHDPIPPSNLNYFLSKLSETRHFEWAASFFLDEYENNNRIVSEIENMRNNLENELEYYSSYNYIELILGKYKDVF